MASMTFARSSIFRLFTAALFFSCLVWVSAAFLTPSQAQAAVGTCNFRCVNTTESSQEFADGAACNAGCFTRCQDYCSGGNTAGVVLGGCSANVCGAPLPAYSGCVATAFNIRNAGERRTFSSEVNSITGSASLPASSFVCQPVPFDGARCVTRGCGGSEFCCLPAGTGGPAVAANPCRPESLADINRLRTAQRITEPASQWSCQRVCEEARRQSRCIVGGCAGDDTAVCCAPTTGPTATTQNRSLCTATATSTARTPAILGGIGLPACTQSGNCTLDDIVATGASFANFLFGLSGALFLLIFVYGGFRYVMSAGDAKVVGEAKNMIVNATTGMVLMIMATTIVRFVQRTITTDVRSVGQVSTCEQQFARQGFECQYVAGDTAIEINRAATNLGCQRPSANLCNLQGQEQFRCCPLTESAGPTPSPTPTP